MRNTLSTIAGIYQLTGQPADPRWLGRMMTVTCPGGVNDVGYWTGGPVGMSPGYPPDPSPGEEGRPPASITGGRCWISWSGRLDNRNELCQAVASRVDRHQVSDAALVLQAYAKWQTGCVSRLLGAFAFVIWDSQHCRLFCARDLMGVMPFYYFVDGRMFAWASEVKQLLQLPAVPRYLNERMIGAHLTATPGPAGETFYQSIFQLPPAHGLVVENDGIHRWRYSDILPDGRIRYGTDAEYADHFRELFRKAVQCRLRASQPVGVLLSGGLDSSSVACMAAESGGDGWAPAADPPITTFTWTFDELATADERAFSRLVARKYGLPAHEIPGDDKWPLRDYPAMLPDVDEPFQGHYQYLLRSALEQASAHGIGVLLDGMPGDNIVGSVARHYPDLVRHWQLRRLVVELWEHGRRHGQNFLQLLLKLGILPLIPSALKRPVRALWGTSATTVPAWIRPAFQTRIDLPGLIRQADPNVRFQSYGSQRRYELVMDPFIPRTAVWLGRLAASSGIEVRHPWLDVRLIQFILAIPAEQTGRGGNLKLILRNALRGYLPEAVRHRWGKAYPTPLLDRGLREREVAKVRLLIEDSVAHEQGYIDKQHLRAAYESYVSGKRQREHPIWYALTLEMWLRRVLDEPPLPGAVRPESVYSTVLAHIASRNTLEERSQ